MKKALLQNGTLIPWLEEQLAVEYDLTQLHRQSDPVQFLKAHGERFEGLVTSARFGADRALLQALPNLRAISSFGVGYDTFDLACARVRGIPIGYTPDVLNDCVADTAFGLLCRPSKSDPPELYCSFGLFALELARSCQAKRATQGRLDCYRTRQAQGRSKRASQSLKPAGRRPPFGDFMIYRKLNKWSATRA